MILDFLKVLTLVNPYTCIKFKVKEVRSPP